METEFEDLVADSLRRHAAAVVIPPDLTGMADQARRRRRQVPCVQRARSALAPRQAQPLRSRR